LLTSAPQVHIQARQDYLKDHELDAAFYNKQFQHVFGNHLLRELTVTSEFKIRKAGMSA